MFFEENSVILFQGDSITDCFRNKDDNSDLGQGYVSFVKKALVKKFPNIKVLNKGVAGHTSGDLLARWDTEFEEVKPDVVCILIGVNDVWENLHASRVINSDEDFRKNYEAILQKVKKEGKKIIIIEPFLAHISETFGMLKDFSNKLLIVKELAVEYADVFVGLDSAFLSEAIKQKNPKALCNDGVHPNNKGHRLICNKFLEAIEFEA